MEDGGKGIRSAGRRSGQASRLCYPLQRGWGVYPIAEGWAGIIISATVQMVNSVQTGQATGRSNGASLHVIPSATRAPAYERREAALYFVYREHRIFHPCQGRIREATGH